MIKNKRAMFFTLLAIAILSLIVISYTFYSGVRDRRAINKRIETMNDFVFSVEQDLPRQLYISAFRIIFLFESYIIESGDYMTDLNNTFEEIFFNGTIYGVANNKTEQLMNRATFAGIQESINEKANKINANVNLTNPLLTVVQEDPWHVKFVLITDLLVRDDSNLVLWNKTSSVTSYVPIENFEDPIYIVGTGGLVTNKINRTVYSSFVQGSDISNLISHLENSYYINNSAGPSFLDRLGGKKTGSENGIESLVYLPRLSAQGIAVKDKSSVDYIYFSDDNPGACNIQGSPSAPSWFKLHNSGFYGASCV